jgi:hypothetical protein
VGLQGREHRLSCVGRRHEASVRLIETLQAENLWPPIVPTMVLAESTTGAARTGPADLEALTEHADGVVIERV